MNDIVGKLVTWTDEYSGDPIPADLVPGTTDTERRQLAALGGVARALAGHEIAQWPTAVQGWAERGPCLPVPLRDKLCHHVSSDDEVLALVYERIVSGRNRRRLGTFFTPQPIVRFLLDRAEELIGAPGIVVDPGAGVGAISLAACRRWPKARVYAVDVNVVTLGLLAALAARLDAGPIQLVHDDYLEWIGSSPPSSASARLIIGNPPYTRHQELPQKLGAQFRERVSQLITSGLASLSAYFLAASLQALDDEDGLVFLLPGSWTETRYGRELRQALWDDGLRRTELYSFPPNVRVFGGTKVTSMVLGIGSRESCDQPVIICPVDLDGTAVRMSELKQLERATTNPESLGLWLWSSGPASTVDTNAVPLGQIARVRRGVATGANAFFFLTDRQKRNLPAQAVLPALLHLGDASNDVLDQQEHDAIGTRGGRRWLFRPADPALARDERVQRLISGGKEAGLHDRYLAKEREPWYLVEQVQPPDIFIGSMGKGRLPAVVNDAHAVPSNSIYGIYLGLGAPSARALAEWLNSDEGQQALRSVARHYGGGLLKLEPKALLSVRIPPREFAKGSDEWTAGQAEAVVQT